MTWFAVALMLLVAITAPAIVRTRDVTAQVISLGFYGLLLALVFFYFQAPDVALSQVVVGAVALPLMVMLAISRMRFRDRLQQAQGGSSPTNPAGAHLTGDGQDGDGHD